MSVGTRLPETPTRQGNNWVKPPQKREVCPTDHPESDPAKAGPPGLLKANPVSPDHKEGRITDEVVKVRTDAPAIDH